MIYTETKPEVGCLRRNTLTSFQSVLPWGGASGSPLQRAEVAGGETVDVNEFLRSAVWSDATSSENAHDRTSEVDAGCNEGYGKATPRPSSAISMPRTPFRSYPLAHTNPFGCSSQFVIQSDLDLQFVIQSDVQLPREPMFSGSATVRAGDSEILFLVPC